MKKVVYKITFPDGDYEYWTEIDMSEVSRLETLYGDKLIIEEVTL